MALGTNTLDIYARDGTLRVYDMDTGAIRTDTTVEPVEGQQSVMMNNEGDGYVWLELRDNARYETTAGGGVVKQLVHRCAVGVVSVKLHPVG